ncbi:MAG: polysaccharide deacetylase family protein [Clostridiales bacterium]|nr:polysaccharide deacetylase family protein [Clostridiales bacterium]
MILLTAAFFCGCTVLPPPPEPSRAPQAARMPPERTAVPARRSTPRLETPLPPSPTPVPRVNAPWYRERNTALFSLIQRDGCCASDAEIDAAIERMYIDPDKPMVALTFDDGPIPGVTDRILDVLEQYNARATFFVCGWRFRDNDHVKSIARRAVALGCEIGNHTWGHEDLQKLHNIVEKRRTLKDTNKAIFDATGFVARSFRPPGGHIDWDINHLARESGMAVVLWSQSGNVNETDPEKIAQNVQKQAVNGRELQDGDIILLHDTKPYMVNAVEIIVPQLLEEGYQLVTVWELLNCSEEGFVPGETYCCQTLH